MNLECCVSARGSPTSLIPHKPFFFRAHQPGVGALQAVGASVAGVVNNHALDFGPDALADTVSHLRHAGIAGTPMRAKAAASSDRAVEGGEHQLRGRARGR
ncbi:MAG: CapA family protein [Actinomycetota bacterium]|nr:CapA family protein [Actinomycetota bacterium]